jgi:hypothetical protein
MMPKRPGFEMGATAKTDGELWRDGILQILAQCQEVRLAYIFDAKVNGAPETPTQLNLGVLFEDHPQTTDRHSRLTRAVGCALGIDECAVVRLDQAPIELAYAIVSRGQLLYQRNLVTRVEYETDILSRHGDHLFVLRAQRNGGN